MTDIQLSEKSKAFIEKQVAAGAYQNADEVIAASLSRLEGEDELLRRMIAEADAQFEKGEFQTLKDTDTLADSIIERGMQLLNRKS